MMVGTSFYGTGRRKSAIARVFVRKGTGSFVVNHKKVDEYFTRPQDLLIVAEPLEIVELAGQLDVFVTVKGGGSTGQAGAIVHGLARALVAYDAKDTQDEEGVFGIKKKLRSCGMLTRDARCVERKKVGKPKARRSKQFSKR